MIPPEEYEREIRELHAELETLAKRVESAFLRDDTGDIDFIAHRKFHKDQINSRQQFEESKRKIMVSVFSWVGIGVLTIIGNAIAQFYLFAK